ncbi:MAG: high frequency lysogenization protein HflD [Alphaproteobacteria bacterium]
MGGFLALGFLIGMQHALEADHLAAVGAMAANEKSSRRGLALRGAVWGLGHTITLFAICSAVIMLGMALTDRAAAGLEFAVGVMLVLLGVDVIRRLRKKRIHYHVHAHDDSRPHLHAHSHEGQDVPHANDPHVHRHPTGFPVRALFIGLIHGAAGSAGLIALAVAATQDPWLAVAYVAVFGFGSILGMAALSFVAAWPLGAIEKHARLAHTGLSIGAAVLAIGLGVNVMLETGALAFGTA